MLCPVQRPPHPLLRSDLSPKGRGDDVARSRLSTTSPSGERLAAGRVRGPFFAFLFAWTVLALLPAAQTQAASYFCSPNMVAAARDLPELNVRFNPIVEVPPFWFDSQSGDLLVYADGAAGQLQAGILPVPLDVRRRDRAFLVAVIFEADQCVPSPMGTLPPPAAKQ